MNTVYQKVHISIENGKTKLIKMKPNLYNFSTKAKHDSSSSCMHGIACCYGSEVALLLFSWGFGPMLKATGMTHFIIATGIQKDKYKDNNKKKTRQRHNGEARGLEFCSLFWILFFLLFGTCANKKKTCRMNAEALTIWGSRDGGLDSTVKR